MIKTTLPGIFICTFCFKNGEVEHPDTYREVTSWVSGPKLDGPKLREQTGRAAHKHCVEREAAGQAADQPTLVDDDPVEDYLNEVSSMEGVDDLSLGAQMGHPGGHYG